MFVHRHVRLEPIGPEHAEAVQRLAAHPEIVATTNLPDPYPPGSAEAWIEWVRPRHTRGEEFAFAVRAGRRIVGVCGLIDVDPKGGTAEFGYWIGRPYWGRGYATTAGRLALDFAFVERGLQRITARPLARNRASCRVLEKLDFAYLGSIPNPFPKWPAGDLIAFYERLAQARTAGWS